VIGNKIKPPGKLMYWLLRLIGEPPSAKLTYKNLELQMPKPNGKEISTP
jgi:hypothetical protein